MVRLGAVVVAGLVGLGALAGCGGGSAGPQASPSGSPTRPAPAGQAGSAAASFVPSLGLSRTTVEERMAHIGDRALRFVEATPIQGHARVLGAVKQLYTVAEIVGSPEATEVEVTTLLDTASASTLTSQVAYDADVCGVLAGSGGQAYCLDHILSPAGSGFVVGSARFQFGAFVVGVKTSWPAPRHAPPVVDITVSA